MREADGGGGNTIQGLFSSDLHFPWGYVDVGDRWNKKLLGRLCMYVWMDGWMDEWMDGCNHACMNARVYVCTYELPDDNKQEILEPKLFNVFC